MLCAPTGQGVLDLRSMGDQHTAHHVYHIIKNLISPPLTIYKKEQFKYLKIFDYYPVFL